MGRKLGLVLAIVLVVGLVGLAQTAVMPRVLEGGVLLFDNESGATATKIGIVFDVAVPLETTNFLAFGGGEATLVATSNNFVFVDVVVVAGGTLQVTLPTDLKDAQVTGAYWFE